MTSTDLLLVAYCAAIVLASLAGGWLPSLVRLTHTRLQLMMSTVSGLMLGVAVLHMLPHAVEYFAAGDQSHAVFQAAVWLLVGVLGMFFLIRTFHFHQHTLAEEGAPQHAHAAHDCEHDQQHPHDHAHARRHEHSGPALGGAHRASWVGLAAGLALHTAVDGVALAASVSAEAGQTAVVPLLGLGTFLAVVLHKPLDALSITSVMAAGNWPARTRTLVNAGFALMCPLGALAFRLSLAGWVQGSDVLVGAALAFSAGVFLCISLGDLLPELQFHSHDRLKLSAALLLGVALAVAIELLPGHSHGGHNHSQPQHELHDE
jgi:zinc and cadmium transporter